MDLKESIYQMIDNNRLGHSALEARRNIKESSAADKRVRAVLDSHYAFVDHSKGREKLCIILAGYKQPLWDDVFQRIATFLPNDVDMCIMTSGLVDEDLLAIAEEHEWSYLTTEVNHLSYIQNLAIELHPQAKWIYKLDEDMFITEGFFETMKQAWDYACENTLYIPAFVSPLINVNCYGHLRLLDKVGLLDDFRATGLTDMKIAEGLRNNQHMLENPAVARYLWGDTQPILRNIDELSRQFAQEPITLSVCPVRFSIGAILFSRENWDEFGHFPITFVGGDYGLGDDEEHIGHYAFQYGKTIIVSENNLVGHLGYGPQTSEMIQYYNDHKGRFALR